MPEKITGDKVLVIGWDVGGWMSGNHGFAILEFRPGKEELIWKGWLNNRSISEDELLELDSVLADGGLTAETRTLKMPDLFAAYDKIVIGVDAPLGLPYDYHDFINNKNNIIMRPGREINNPLAYRRTDRLLYQKFGKKPLSATFDRLGTNYTVAAAHIRRWQQKYDFKLIPQEARDANRQIVEVYPGILKKLKSEFSGCRRFFQMLPKRITKGEHSYDAALSALQGLAVLLAGSWELPEMKRPERIDEITATEGWIFFPAVET